MSGFNGTGFLFRQTLAGAAQFTGAAGLGQVTFAGLGGGLDYGAGAAEPKAIPKIKAIGYDAAGAAHEVHFRLVRAVGAVAGGDRIRVGGSRIKDDGTYALTLEASVICAEGIPVPAVEPLPGPVVYYQLQIITLGKTGNATVTVWYDIEAP